ncbi:MAG: agmatinase [Acidimicrobiia bacterium]|nr:MAG: agmatinase [Acidimicrobiia bacterium]
MIGFGHSSFSARATFAGVPHRSLDDLGGASVAILGAPFDWGTSHRPGARFGPKAVRDADYLEPDGARPHLDTGIDPLAVLGAVDLGDVHVVPGYVDESLQRIRQVVGTVAAAGVVPVVIGGDHTITFADAGGVADAVGHGEVALIHFDAHADTGDSHYGMLHGHGTPMRRLIESGAVPGHRFVQIGLRGYWPDPPTVAWMREQGMRSHFMAEIVERGLDAVVDDAVEHAALGAKGVFVSVDVDVVDPSAAPGTGTPEPGGLTARQLLDTVRRLGRDLNVVGADVVEVAPAYDTAEITALLANRVVLELLNGMAQRRVSA